MTANDQLHEFFTQHYTLRLVLTAVRSIHVPGTLRRNHKHTLVVPVEKISPETVAICRRVRAVTLSFGDFADYKTVSGIGNSSAETEPAAPVICTELEIKPVCQSSHVRALSLRATPSGG